jgi:glycine dehydrogenase
MKTDAFALRHIGPRENDLEHMLKNSGAATLDQLIRNPSDIRLKSDLESAMTE